MSTVQHIEVPVDKIVLLDKNPRSGTQRVRACMRLGYKQIRCMVFSAGQDYHRCYEPCFLGLKKGKKHFIARGIETLKDVFALSHEDYREAMDVWYERRDVTNTYVHPTQKPVRLAESMIK